MKPTLSLLDATAIGVRAIIAAAISLLTALNFAEQIQRLNRRAFIGLVAGGFLAVARAAGAQPPFRLTFRRERDDPSSIVLVGELFNDGSRDVIDVWVTAEGLNVGGRVAVRGIAFVGALIPGRGSTTFTVKLARAGEVRSFSVFVSSFRYGLGTESP